METHGNSHEFSSIELDQLWRALQYSLWMADKRPVQQQFAAESVLLIRKIDPKFVIDWNRAFWFNIDRIYATLDKYRIPKFHLLLRIYVSEFVGQINIHGLDNLNFITQMIAGMTGNLKKSTGAYIHVVSIFVDELIAVLGVTDISEKIHSDKAVLALMEMGLHAINNAPQFPTSVIAKTCETFLTNTQFVQFSSKVKTAVKSAIQSIALKKETDQDVRDILFGFVDVIDAIPVVVVKPPKKAAAAATKEEGAKKTKKSANDDTKKKEENTKKGTTKKTIQKKTK